MTSLPKILVLKIGCRLRKKFIFKIKQVKVKATGTDFFSFC